MDFNWSEGLMHTWSRMKSVLSLLYKRKLRNACPQYSAPASCWMSSSGRNSIPSSFSKFVFRCSFDREREGMDWEQEGMDWEREGMGELWWWMENDGNWVRKSRNCFCSISSKIFRGWDGRSTNWRMWFTSRKDCSIVLIVEDEEEESSNTINGRLHLIINRLQIININHTGEKYDEKEDEVDEVLFSMSL